MITIEEYWDEFVEGEKDGELPNVVTNFEFFKKGFEEGLIHKMKEEYDIIDIILEVAGHNGTCKNFQNLDEFIEVLKKDYFEDLEENFHYLYPELVSYYTLSGKDEKLSDCLKILEKNANDQSDDVWETLILLLCSNKISIYKDFLHHSYLELKRGNASSPLVRELEDFKYNLILSEILEKHQKGETIDYDSYNEVAEDYRLDIIESLIQEDLKVFDETETEIDWEAVKADDLSAFHMCKIRFAKYAQQKGISFPIAFYLFDKMKEYWSIGEQKPKDLFVINPGDFYQFTLDLGNIVGSLEPEMYAFLYGSFYVYDFLLLNNGIDETTYHGYKMIHANVREKMISKQYFRLWNYSFVHEWEVPDGWKKEWQDRETELFKETLNLTYYREADKDREKEVLEAFQQLLPPKEDRLDKKYKLPDRSKNNPYANMIKNLDFSKLSTPKPPKPKIPSREVDLNNRLPKVGRNEKVTVKYANGTIKKDVKYKKVMRDVESGKCTII